jgi:flagellar basal-body rod modification protein FlgD
MAGLSPAQTSLPIAGLINTTGTPTTPSSSSTSVSDAQLTAQLGPTAFLTLLTTQLANQDPLNPMDDTQSVSQLAQFSALQASDNLESSFSNFQSNFAVLQSAQLIGKNVTVNEGTSSASGQSSSSGSTVTGTVAGVSIVNGAPAFTLTDSNGNTITDSNGNPLQFTTSQIVGING